MANRIDKLFARKGKDILSVYFTAGYPGPDDTTEIICSLDRAGVDLVEIGIPFSDPMADGPVIQRSSSQAIANGMSLRRLFAALENVRERSQMPLIMMGYLNPVMQFGPEQFCRECVRVGIDGVIIPDLPFDDYMADYKPLAERYGLRFIMLITPQTSPERIRLIDRHTSGFIYMVSTASTTGARESFPQQTLDYFRRIDEMKLRNPRLIGFGISNKATFDAACDNAHGGIIGSEFVKRLGSGVTIPDAVGSLMKALGR